MEANGKKRVETITIKKVFADHWEGFRKTNRVNKQVEIGGF